MKRIALAIASSLLAIGVSIPAIASEYGSSRLAFGANDSGFILDVLANYTTYRSYYEIQKSIADNSLFVTAKDQKKLR